MKITFILINNRPGSIDIFGHAFATQQDPGDYEIVVVDGYPGRVERGAGEFHLTGTLGLPVRAYVAPKPKTFPFSRTGFANAMNTGLFYAAGEYVVFVHDFTSLPPDAVRRWKDTFAVHNHSTLVHGIANEYDAPKPTTIEDVTTWKDYPVPLTLKKNWIPDKFEIFYWGGPITFFEATNGIDERSDFCTQFSLASLNAQAKAHGYDMLVDPSLVCHMIDHRAWDDLPNMSSHNSQWRMKGVFSDVPEEPIWTGWGANPYNLKLEREKIAEVYGRPFRIHPRHHLIPPKE